MTALADFDALRAAVTTPAAVVFVLKASPDAVPETTGLQSWWFATDSYPAPGVAPTTAAACDSSTVGGLPHPGVDSRLVSATISRVVTGGWVSPVCLLVDRLSHQGGLSGNVTGAQTTNLPTAALTRYTDGVGVMVGLEVYSDLGSTNTTVTVSYTNTADVAGRAGTIAFIDTPFDPAFYPMPLQSGDLGVKSVESVSLAGGTGAVGNFGMTIYKPLCLFGGGPDLHEDVPIICGWNTDILAGACLQILGLSTGSAPDLNAVLAFSEA